MVKRIIKYECEFPGCNKKYLSRKQAEKCESQGVIGPDIRPGFTLGTPPHGYIVSLDSVPQKGHEKEYPFIWIIYHLDFLKDYEGSFELSNILSIKPRKYKISSLESLIKKGEIRLLDNNEFRQLSQLIHHGESMINVREVLEVEGIEKLYRTHSYFNE